MPTIKLQSSDNRSFDVEVEIAKKSVTIKTMLDNLGLEDEDRDIPIPLSNMNGEVLQKIIEWCTHHKDDPPAEEDENAEKHSDDISEWDKKFLEIEQCTLFNIILAANYLDIKGLLDVACKTVANMLQGKTPQEISKIFKTDTTATDPSPEEPTTDRKVPSDIKDSESKATCSA